jgi:hypothetical protein
MTKKIVVLVQIPGLIQRGVHKRTDLRYAEFGKITWRWWCRQRGIHFAVIDKPIGKDKFPEMPPTFQRWLVPDMVIKEFGSDFQIAMVDADTMIRWDAPDLFGLVGPTLAAVQGLNAGWIYRSIRAYQHLFPDVALSWWEYFNAGLVVLGIKQLATINAYLDFVGARRHALRAVELSGNFGTDQTPLNFFMRLAGESVQFLPRPFNVLNCLPSDPMIFALEMNPTADEAGFAAKVFARPGFFDFIDFGYVWHFSSIFASRYRVMSETWNRIRQHYPGAQIDE